MRTRNLNLLKNRKKLKIRAFFVFENSYKNAQYFKIQNYGKIKQNKNKNKNVFS